MKPSELRVRRLGVGLDQLQTPDATPVGEKRGFAEISGFSGGPAQTLGRTGMFRRHASHAEDHARELATPSPASLKDSSVSPDSALDFELVGRTPPRAGRRAASGGAPAGEWAAACTPPARGVPEHAARSVDVTTPLSCPAVPAFSQSLHNARDEILNLADSSRRNYEMYGPAVKHDVLALIGSLSSHSHKHTAAAPVELDVEAEEFFEDFVYPGQWLRSIEHNNAAATLKTTRRNRLSEVTGAGAGGPPPQIHLMKAESGSAPASPDVHGRGHHSMMDVDDEAAGVRKILWADELGRTLEKQCR